LLISATEVVGSRRKAFFFEKKKQKTFASLRRASPERPKPDVQEFFGSFFQKGTPLLLPMPVML
jgi:hypothetical protein